MPTHTLHRVGYRLAGVALGLFVPAVVMAQGVGGGLPVDKTYATIANGVVFLAELLNMLTWIVFTFLIFLLDPRFMFAMPVDGGGEGSLMMVLNSIWQLSRNLMNVAFAVTLVISAIYTVVTANRDLIDSHRTKFILAVILVNFSWFVPRVILDVANIATATVFSIPSAMVNTHEETACRYQSTTMRGCIDPKALPGGGAGSTCACKAVADFIPFPEDAKVTELDDTLPGGRAAGPDDPLAWQCTWAYCIRYIRLDAAATTAHAGVLNGLVVNHGRLPQLAMITRTARSDKITDLLSFILREAIVLVIHVALFFPLLALLVAFVVRIPALWLTMAFMPFYFLTLAIPEEFPIGVAREKAKKVMEIFVKAAFLPAAVAIPLSIGFIMANAGSRIDFPGISNIKISLIDGMGNFGQLLWVIMVLGILWSGTFMVLEEMMVDEVPGKNLVKGIKNSGEALGKAAYQLPLSTIPIPGPAGNALGFLNKLSSGDVSGMFGGKGGGKSGGAVTSPPSPAHVRAVSATAGGAPAELIRFDTAVKKFAGLATPTASDLKALTSVLKSQGMKSPMDKTNIHVVVESIQKRMAADGVLTTVNAADLNDLKNNATKL